MPLSASWPLIGNMPEEISDDCLDANMAECCHGGHSLQRPTPGLSGLGPAPSTGGVVAQRLGGWQRAEHRAAAGSPRRRWERVCGGRALDVAAVAVGPADWAHSLRGAACAGRDALPWQRLRRLARVEHAELLQDAKYGGIQVEAVHMEARHAAFKDALAHFSPVLNAECLQTCLVVLQRLDLVMELLRHLGLAEAGHALESAICHDRHNTRNNRHINADRAAVLDKLEEDVHVVEKLRDDELTACLNLLLQILDIVPVILLHLLRVIHNCVWVCLRVACHCDAKVITKLFPDELDQVQRAAKAPLDGLKLFLALGRIATQRKDVLDALLLGLHMIENAVNGNSRRPDRPCCVVATFSVRNMILRHTHTSFRADSSVSTVMLVHVRCIIVSTQICVRMPP
eukprot:190732-Chlamydomonas_euryale.AAC.18